MSVRVVATEPRISAKISPAVAGEPPDRDVALDLRMTRPLWVREFCEYRNLREPEKYLDYPEFHLNKLSK
ncbi:hypothetical protein BH10ACT9_BH10ACT9_15000 [soil metagenome]|jgi:hypothetical protein